MFTVTDRLSMTSANTPRADSAAIPSVSRGRFVWYDLMTTDVPAATAFYTKVAGWGTQEFDTGPDRKYQMWTAGGVPIGGAVLLGSDKTSPGTPPHWLASIAVPSVDDSVRQAIRLGGKLLTRPMDIPETGRYAKIADPQGAVVALFAPLHPAAATVFTPKLSEFSWHELVTTNHEAAFAFYSALFGWERMGEHDVGAPVGTYLLFGQPGDQPAGAEPLAYGGMYSTSPAIPMPPSWLYYIHVPSADDAAKTVTALGGQVLNGPMEVPGGDSIAQCMDPQGAMFAVHSTRSSGVA